VYQEDKEGTSLYDAAGFWGNTGTGSGFDHLMPNRGDERRYSLEQQVPSPQKATDGEDPLVPASRRSVEGGLMPFDMDVPVAYGSVTAGNMSNIQIGITDIASGTVVSSAGMAVVEEGDPVSGDVRASTSIMENIETERVPCPRLCGATFGSGNGGLVIFHNGEVKKMWDWYQRNDTIRLSGIPGGKADSSSSDPDALRMVHNTTGTRTSNPLSPQVEGPEEYSEVFASSGPRSLKDLLNMITTAKEVRGTRSDSGR
jgi:hypothetical protein